MRTLTALWLAVGVHALAQETKPLHLHPDNPHYFQFRGQAAVLITSGEHYGAVINRDFDFVRYLDELAKHGFNLTRIFSGTYREIPGSFNIVDNTLAPGSGKFLCPWARAANGKFDLNRWDENYFQRLKDFVEQAGRRGIVVELVLFCTMYNEDLWQASPMNATNNVNGIGKVGRYDVYNAKDPSLLAAQKAVTRKIVKELNNFDNLYYEICNEPYERGGLTREWNDQIVAAIVGTEASLPFKHLIAQGFPPSDKPVSNLNPAVSVLNFHAARTASVRLNYGLRKAIAHDETGGSDRGDRKYRTEGWEFILAGGAVYDHLDFSFTIDRPDGTAVPLPSATPGGGGPELRRQLAILKRFIEAFEFVRMMPQASGSNVYVMAEPGKAYAVYLKDGAKAHLELDLPHGSYGAEWMDPRSGAIIYSEQLGHEGSLKKLNVPRYVEDVALRLRRLP